MAEIRDMFGNTEPCEDPPEQTPEQTARVSAAEIQAVLYGAAMAGFTKPELEHLRGELVASRRVAKKGASS